MGDRGSVESPLPDTTRPESVQALHRLTSDVSGRLLAVSQAFAQERRLVTAVFADISGFTSLAESLDPEQLLDVIDPIVSSLADAVSEYEGYVEKFAGDAIMVFFGAPVAREDDAVRALLVALEMHRRLPRLLDGVAAARHLTLHIGVNTGHVVGRLLSTELRVDYAVLGDAVILAQRLQAATPAGTTYVGDTTRRLTEHRFDFEDAGELAVKGKRVSVRAWRLVGEKTDPPPRRPGAAAPHRILGRADDVERLVRALEPTGRASVVCLSGEPGVGKTRLIHEARLATTARGMRWLPMSAMAFDGSLPYRPYIDLLQRLLRLSPQSDPTTTRARAEAAFTTAAIPEVLPFIVRLLGLTHPATVDLEPEAFRRGLHGAMAMALARLAADSPVVLLLEDVQWLDASSRALTADLIAASQAVPVAVVLVARPEALDATLEMTATMTHGHRTVMTLKPLDPAAVAELADDLLGGPPDASLQRFLVDHTAGNPFFVEETVRSLRDFDFVERTADGSWRTTPAWTKDLVPVTVESVVSARLDLLTRSQATTLATVAVVGRRALLTLVRVVADDVPDVDGTIAELVDAQFLDRVADDPGQEVLFHHALTHKVTYERMLRRQRRDLHLRVAAAVEQVYGDGDEHVDLLAHHLYLGDAGSRAVDFLLRAAARDRGLFANDEALVHLEHALEVLGSHPELEDQVASVQLEMATLLDRVGRYEEAERLFTEVRDRSGDVEAWRGIASVRRRRGDVPGALELLDQAMPAISGRGGDVRALWLERGWCLGVQGRYRESIEALNTGLAEASERHDRLTGHLLFELSVNETMAERADEALDHARQAEEIFEEFDDLSGMATALRVIGAALGQLGRDDEAAATLRRGLAVAERVGKVEEVGACLINLGFVELHRGDLDEAIICDRRALAEFERVGIRTGLATASANLSEKLLFRGQVGEALSQAEHAIALATSTGQDFVLADALATLAEALDRSGQTDAAARRAEESGRLFEGMGVTTRAADAYRLAARLLDSTGQDAPAAALRTRAATITR